MDSGVQEVWEGEANVRRPEPIISGVRTLILAYPRVASLLFILGLSATATLGLNSPAYALAMPVTNRALLGATDLIDWGMLGPASAVVGNPSNVSSNGGGTNAAVSMPSGSFQRFDQQQPPSTTAWAGSFAPGDHVLWTSLNNNGPITIVFASPVFGAGAQIEKNFNSGETRSFTATLTVFDPSNTKLLEYTLPGFAQYGHDNSAIFLGVKDSTADIKRIVFSTGDATSLNDFAINQLSLVNTAVPEPSNLLLTASGLLGLVGVGALRRRRRNVLVP
jgi:hypothetical protein